MSLRKCTLGFMLILQLAGALAKPPDAEVERRLQSLSGELRCLVCQNQSLADSDADLAVELRRELRRMIEAGQSDSQIRDFLVARYGEFVLYDPPFRPATLLLWLGPPVFLAFALGLLVRNFRKQASGTIDQ